MVIDRLTSEVANGPNVRVVFRILPGCVSMQQTKYLHSILPERGLTHILSAFDVYVSVCFVPYLVAQLWLQQLDCNLWRQLIFLPKDVSVGVVQEVTIIQPKADYSKIDQLCL